MKSLSARRALQLGFVGVLVLWVALMTGTGGAAEDRDTIKEILPEARDLATYQPKPEWQTVLQADAIDFIEFVSPGRVLIGTVQFGSRLAMPEFAAVELYDSGTGQKVWEGKRKDIKNGSFSLLAADPVILLYGAGTKVLYFTALDPRTGATLWERQANQPAVSFFDGERGSLLVGAAGGKALELSALRIADGSPAWSQTLPLSSPEVVSARDADSLFIAGDQVFKVSVQTGAIKWAAANPAAGAPAALLLAKPGVVLYSQNRLWMMDAATGSLRWGPLEITGAIVCVSAPGDGTIYVVTRETTGGWKDTVRAVMAESGKTLWQQAARMPVRSPLLYGSGALFFSTNGSLERLDGRTGKARWSTTFPPGWGWAPTNEVPDVLVARNNHLILASEKNGVAAFSQLDGKPVWRQRLDFVQGANFWYLTKEMELSVAAQMAGQLVKSAREDMNWWRNYVKAVDLQWNGPEYLASHGQSSFGTTMVLTQSLLALSSGIESALKGLAVDALIERKQIELNYAVKLQVRSLQGKHWVRPFNKRGTSVAVVDLDSGKRVDVQFSAPNIGMSLYGARLPCVRMAPDGKSFITAEVGIDESKYTKYVKFKMAMPYPSLMSYGLAKLAFRETIWDDADLALAAEKGDLEKVKALLRGGAWADSRNVLGSTALTAAAAGGHSEVARLLMASGATLDAGSAAGKSTAIEMASYGGHAAIVKMLLDAGAQPYKAVEFALTRGHGGVMKVFREAGRLQVKTPTDAVAFGTAEDVRIYFKDKKEADRPLERSVLTYAEGTTPLMLASDLGNLEAARYLLELGANVNLKQKSNQKESALMKASARGYTEVARLLISRGAEVNATDTDRMTALYKAAQLGHADTVRLLLDSGAGMGAKSRIYEDTALTEAAASGHVEVVKVLLGAGANVNEANKEKETALIKAAWSGHVAVAEALLQAGADVRLKNKQGSTALDAAKASFMSKPEDKSRMIELLEKAAAK